jgi:hypothetical protein
LTWQRGREMRGGHPLKWQRGKKRGETPAEVDAKRTRKKFDLWEGREKNVWGRGVSLGKNRFGGNEWGDGDKLGEEGMWKEDSDWGKVVVGERQKRKERGDGFVVKLLYYHPKWCNVVKYKFGAERQEGWEPCFFGLAQRKKNISSG